MFCRFKKGTWSATKGKVDVFDGTKIVKVTENRIRHIPWLSWNGLHSHHPTGPDSQCWLLHLRTDTDYERPHSQKALRSCRKSGTPSWQCTASRYELLIRKKLFRKCRATQMWLQTTSFFTSSQKRTERQPFPINYSDREGFRGHFDGPPTKWLYTFS